MAIILSIVFVALIISLHEASHAYAAHLLGDDTAKDFGRMTLDPRAHLDPFGTVLLPLLLILLGLPVFGWAKPTPFNPLNLENPKRDSALIALAGPLSNLVLASLLAAIARTLYAGDPFSITHSLLYPMVLLNAALAVFNLLPIPPLDGFKIIGGVLPDDLAISWYHLSPYGPLILLALLFLPGLSLIDLFVNPLLNTLLGLLLGF